MNLYDRRDTLFALYDRGILTASEIKHRFVSLTFDAPDDNVALSLCDSLPDWFRTTFREWLSELAERDYAYQWFGVGDMRTEEQRESEARQHQAFLKRVAPQLHDRL